MSTNKGPNVNVTIEVEDNALIVRFGGVTHLRVVDRRKILGIQTWRIRKISRYYILFTFEGGATLTTDYDVEAKWIAIIDGLDKVL